MDLENAINSYIKNIKRDGNKWSRIKMGNAFFSIKNFYLYQTLSI